MTNDLLTLTTTKIEGYIFEEVIGYKFVWWENDCAPFTLKKRGDKKVNMVPLLYNFKDGFLTTFIFLNFKIWPVAAENVTRKDLFFPPGGSEIEYFHIKRKFIDRVSSTYSQNDCFAKIFCKKMDPRKFCDSFSVDYWHQYWNQNKIATFSIVFTVV